MALRQKVRDGFSVKKDVVIGDETIYENVFALSYDPMANEFELGFMKDGLQHFVEINDITNIMTCSKIQQDKDDKTQMNGHLNVGTFTMSEYGFSLYFEPTERVRVRENLAIIG